MTAALPIESMDKAAKRRAEEKVPVVLPVRRRLMAATVSYLLGIYLTAIVAFPVIPLIVLCAGMLAWVGLRARRRKRVLPCVMILMLLFGTLRTGQILRHRDVPTASSVYMEGTICRVIKPFRVMLKDVSIEGEAVPSRPVVVTLMQGKAGEEGRETLPEPLEGQRVQGTGRLFAPDEPRNVGDNDQRIRALCEGYELSGYLSPGWTAQGDRVLSVSACFRQLRDRIGACIDSLFGEQAALYRGILLGDRSGLDSEITAAMRMTGTAHILTVSGMHLSMIAGLVSLFLTRMPIGRSARFAVMSAFLLFFTGLTGAAPGTVRACTMAMLREYAHLRGRRYEPLTALSCAALLMTLCMPLWALNASFQFSFLVVLGIQLFSRRMSEQIKRILQPYAFVRPLFDMAALPAIAQLASMPMQLLLYGYVPLLALPMNILCGIMMPIMLAGGWCVTVLGMLWPQIGSHLAGLLVFVSTQFERASLWAASLDHAVLRLPAPQGALVLLFIGLMLLRTDRIRLGRWKNQAACLLLFAILAGYMPRINPQARYAQLDVGQGDAAVFASGRRAVIVDVGPANSDDMLRYLRHEGLLVDAVILSHWDAEHTGALETLLSSEIEIPAVLVAQEEEQSKGPSSAVQAVLKHMERDGIPLYSVKRGDQFEINGLILDVLSPDELLSGSNERSLLLHAELEGVTFLLTGDLTQDAEPEMIPDVHVLKVAHHGSKYASSDSFLEQAAPELAIISVGENNRHGHPSERVLTSLEQLHTQVLRTDRQGGIELWLHDGTYRLKTCLSPSSSL